VIRPVELPESLGQITKPRPMHGAGRAQLTDDADLPQDERYLNVGGSLGDKEVRRVVELQAPPAGIDPEIDEQAIDRRNGGEDTSGEALRLRTSNSLVGGVVEDRRMAVRDHADVATCANPSEDGLHDLLVHLVAIAAESIDGEQGLGSRVQAPDPAGRSDLGQEVEDILGLLDPGP
jgi:hypothetical protein